MSQSAQHSLTARLCASLGEGSVVDSSSSSVGTFTLDPEIARERIRRARFANPVRYVLELVQAAVLKGATRISLFFEQGELHMEFDGEPFAQSDYEQLYTSLLLKADSRAGQARQLLALGLCTGLQLEPALIRVESGDSFVELRPGEPDCCGALTPAVAQTHIYVRQRLSLGLLRRYVDHLGGNLTEEVLLQERCRYARVPIELDGKLISHHHTLAEVTVSRRFAAAGICGVVGISACPQPESVDPPPPLESALGPTVLILLKCGVCVDTQLPLELLPGFRALVESEAFHLDTSREHVALDSEYVAAWHEVLRAQLELLAACCRRYLDTSDHAAEGSLGIHHLRALVRALYLRVGGLLPLLGWAHLPPHQFRLADLPIPSGVWPTELSDGAALLEVPIWKSTTGELICASRLLRDFAEYQTVAYSSLRSEGLSLDRPLIVHTAEAGEKELLQALFGKALMGYDAAIELARERERNRAAWQRRPHRPRLSGQVVIVRAALSGPGITGEIGIEPHRIVRIPWKRSLERPGLLRFLFIKDGSLLAEKKVPFPVPDLTVAVAADFTPSYRFDDVLSDAQLAAVIDALFQALPALIEHVSKLPLLSDSGACVRPAGRTDRTMPWRASVLRPLFMLALSATARHAARLAMGGCELPVAVNGEDSRQDSGGSRVEQSLEEQRSGALWQQLLEWPIFEALDGTLLRFDELLQAAARDGYLAILCPKAPLPVQQLEAWVALCEPESAPAAVWRETHEYSPSIAPVGQRPALVVWLSPGERVLRDLIVQRRPELRVVDAEQWLRAVATMAALHRDRATAASAASPSAASSAASAPSGISPRPGLLDLSGTPPLFNDAVPEEITPEPRGLLPELVPPCSPPATPEDRLVVAVLDELRARAPHATITDPLLQNVNLAWLQCDEDPRPLAVVCDSHRFILNRRHPAVQAVLQQSRPDALYVGCLASAAYTALNARLATASHEDAARFLDKVAVRATRPDPAWESSWSSAAESAP